MVFTSSSKFMETMTVYRELNNVLNVGALISDGDRLYDLCQGIRFRCKGRKIKYI